MLQPYEIINRMSAEDKMYVNTDKGVMPVQVISVDVGHYPQCEVGVILDGKIVYISFVQVFDTKEEAEKYKDYKNLTLKCHASPT